MLALALSTLRARRVAFAGSLVAIAMGVALVCAAATLMADALSASGAGRFAAVDAAVVANSTITVGHGNSASAVTVHPPPSLPAAIVGRAAAVSGVARAVGDLAFPVAVFDSQGRSLSARGADRIEAHGWSSAALTPYSLASGGPPFGGRDVVLDTRLAERDRLRIGQRLRIVTPAGAQEFRLTGIATAAARGDPGQSAVFVTDHVAPQLASSPGQVNAVGVFARPGVDSVSLRERLRRVLGPDVTVLDRQHGADADAGDPRAAQRDDAVAFLGTLGALAAVIAVFVVGSTFALTVEQRRRELALLRAVGATPRQVRGMIAGEALVLGGLGGVIGCLAGVPLAAAIGHGLIDHGIAPEGLSADPTTIALLIAVASGVLIAEIAVLASARRAARVPASEALLEAALEPRRLGAGRSVLGVGALAGAVTMVALFHGAGALAFSELTVLLLAAALTLLSPLLLALPAAIVSRPLRASAAGMLASTTLAAHRRRVGAIAAAVMLVVALAGTYAITAATSQAATQNATALRVRAPFVLVARSGPGLPIGSVRLASRTPGVIAAVGTLPTQVYLLDSGLDNFGSPWDAAGLTGGAAAGRMLDLGVRSGSLGSLRGTTIAISTELASKRHLRIGAMLHARLADTTPTTLRVGAIYEHALGLGDIVLSLPLAEDHAAIKLDSAIFVAGPSSVRARLTGLTQAVPTATLLTRSDYLSAVRAADQTSAWIVWLLVALIAAFAGLAILNTSVIATGERLPELRLIRLIGATPRQARHTIAWEALITTLVGAGAGALAARAAVARIAEGRPGWHVVVPPTLFGAIVAGTAALGMLGSLLPGVRLRTLLRSVAGFPESSPG